MMLILILITMEICIDDVGSHSNYNSGGENDL